MTQALPPHTLAVFSIPGNEPPNSLEIKSSINAFLVEDNFEIKASTLFNDKIMMKNFAK